ncbi:MAG TPA: hypothetical protein VF775_01010 [Geobacteraceae bacterium]
MNRISVGVARAFVATLFMLAMPVVMHAQSEPAKTATPPIAQKLVREGDFAVRLQTALGLGTGTDEVAAESRLGEVGITPRNGWIADYPVTPDIVIEVRKSVSAAAEAKRLSIGKDEALKRFKEVSAGVDLTVRPYTGKTEAAPTAAEKYPDPTVINNYYINEGPPVITYYAPPPDYYYLYDWVPCPFWWFDFWFPGFFVLRDFQRVVFINNRVVFISNHFNDIRVHQVFRVDPVARFSGRTFAGIGVANRKGFISTGVPRSERTIFNSPRTRMAPAGRMMAPGGGRMMAPGGMAPGGGRRMAPGGR